jgi:fructan beta-fructosidase
MNKHLGNFILILFTGILISSCSSWGNKKSIMERKVSGYYQEQYRPQFHFSPEAHWMNDPIPR